MTQTAETAIFAKSIMLSELFCEGGFEIPWHQRYYDWEPGHVLELLEDIKEAMEGERRCYFLGTIMRIKKENGRWFVNDGQQRMTTFSLVCAWLCRFFHDAGDDLHQKLAMRILFEIKEGDPSTLGDAQRLTPRLTPPRSNRVQYHQLIRGEDIGENGKLKQAWKEIEKFFEELSGKDNNFCKNYLSFMWGNIEVVHLDIPRDEDKNAIFETLNGRGKQLEETDLIKNYLFSFFNNDDEANRLNTVYGCIEKIYGHFNHTKKSAEYIRCHLQANFGYLPERSLYRDVRNYIKQAATTPPPPPRQNMFLI